MHLKTLFIPMKGPQALDCLKGSMAQKGLRTSVLDLHQMKQL